jgi:monomeric sarcosine oxidase
MAAAYDVIVLGQGVMGSATAYHLAKDGQRVLALEQYELDHRLGSSYGESRIIRYAYDHPAYVEMAKHTFPMWRDLEKVSGRQLLTQTGGLDFGKPDSPTFIATKQNLLAAGVPYEWLTPTDVARRFPQFRLDEDMMGGFQPDAGSLAASLCVITQSEMAQKHGATVLTKTPVLEVEVLRDSVRVTTADAQYEATKLVITAGPWAPRLLETLDLNLPLVPTREQLVFFEPRGGSMFDPEHCPIFILHTKPWFYGIPNIGGSGLKVAIHGRHQTTDHPDTMNRTPDQDYVEMVQGFVRHYMPEGDGPVKESRMCLYTETPDEHFILDQHPAYPHVVIGSGFSGHGFKFGILIGRILADLAVQGTTQYGIDLFSLKRFLS